MQLALATVVMLSGSLASSGDALRATLADPVRPGYIEAKPGTPGVLEGAFTAAQYADYAALTDPSTRQPVIDSLNRNGFVAGYAREWNLRNTRDYLGEIALQFTTDAGARTSTSSSKAQYAARDGFEGFIATGRVADDGFGIRFDGVGGYRWTIVVFAKGHNMYAVAGGSPDDYQTAGTLAQAQREYAFAPSENSAPEPASTIQPWRLAVVLLLIVALMVTSVVAVVVLWPRPAPVKP